jgi:hypothetical protein
MTRTRQPSEAISMQAKRLHLHVLLPLTLAALAGTGCEVTTCGPGEDCVDLDWDGGFDEDGGGGDGDAGADGMDGGESDAGADGGFGDEPLTLTEFCDAQLAPGQAWADLTNTCCNSAAQGSREMARLLAVVGYPGGVGDCEARLGDLLKDGKVKYEPSYAASCARALAASYAPPPSSECPADGFFLPDIEATYGHGVQIVSQIPACRAAFAGTLSRDAPCTHALQCADGLVCRDAPGAIKTCQQAFTAGNCSADSECAPGFTCKGARGASTCVAIDDLGLNQAKCSSSSECVEGLWCDPVLDGQQEEPWCAPPTTSGLAEAGEPCDPETPAFEFQCRGFCDKATSKCAAFCAQ